MLSPDAIFLASSSRRHVIFSDIAFPVETFLELLSYLDLPGTYLSMSSS
ncbi:hypothetical protein [Chlamydia psittaci]|nr:hypothetical protein [Chlamydia psittaci]